MKKGLSSPFGSRKERDRGDSELVSFLILIPLFLAILFTTIDVALYFNSRTAVSSVARDSARSVAIMGGKGTATTASPIESQYGATKAASCTSDLSTHPVTSRAFNGNLTPIECNLLKSLKNNNSLVNVKINQVLCNPIAATYITQRTTCRVDWSYNSIPASGMVLLKKTGENQAPKFSDSNALLGNNTTIGSSESEVNLSGIAMVPRR